jgi:prophage regulatory protein
MSEMQREAPGTAPPALVRFLRRPEVERAVGLGCSAIYDKMSRNEFPKPVPLSGGAVGWIESEIAEWQAQRIAEREKIALAKSTMQEGERRT